ncbi:hypothetical protein [Streptomyces sp. NBC_00151]|uniref:hypothetical protein n=1 Tax=Streptomyces sp. NBC_00151 TaxID=2975669 RepID=UPI002DD9A822|nr:hypothetical protein [Streptomyces sp. NBC_00151]WRZ42770.1 hypothetical protein OG915_34895 [Streptomyces sp. NBC_00151]
MTTTPRLLDAKKSRAVFYRTLNLETSDSRIPLWLTYSAPVLHHVIPAIPAASNGQPVGFSLVATSDGSVRAYSGPVGDYLGLIERGGPRGWFQRFQLERQARKRAKHEQNELKKNEQAAEIAADILKEN